MELRIATDAKWVNLVLQNLNRFMIDHAQTKRKSSQVAMSMITYYPDKLDLVQAMLNLSIEELRQFQQIMTLMHQRQLTLLPEEETDYVNCLCTHLRPQHDAYFLDQLLITSVMEARSYERLQLVADALESGALKEFYHHAAESEANHHQLFTGLALKYFSHEAVTIRLAELFTIEAELIKTLPLRACIH